MKSAIQGWLWKINPVWADVVEQHIRANASNIMSTARKWKDDANKVSVIWRHEHVKAQDVVDLQLALKAYQARTGSTDGCRGYPVAVSRHETACKSRQTNSALSTEASTLWYHFLFDRFMSRGLFSGHSLHSRQNLALEEEARPNGKRLGLARTLLAAPPP